MVRSNFNDISSLKLGDWTVFYLLMLRPTNRFTADLVMPLVEPIDFTT